MNDTAGEAAAAPNGGGLRLPVCMVSRENGARIKKILPQTVSKLLFPLF
jgi:hypothetical protein